MFEAFTAYAAGEPAGGSPCEQALAADLRGPLLNAALDIDPATLDQDSALDFLTEVEKLAAWVAAFREQARAAVMGRLAEAERERATESIGERAGSGFVTPEAVAVAEAAAALHVSPDAMSRAWDNARDLDGPMRPLRDALQRGQISEGHVRAIAWELRRLSCLTDAARSDEREDACAAVLSRVLPYAATHTPAQSGRKTRGLVLAHDPAGARAARRRAAERDHDVWVSPCGDGTVALKALLPVAHGHALFTAVQTLAGDERFRTADGCITAGQRRVAALVALTLGDPGSVAEVTGPVPEAKITVDVSVVVPLATLTGLGEQGGRIGGEIVDAEAVRELLASCAGTSTLRRLVVDSRGAVLDAGRTRYAIGDAQRRLIAVRDRVCRFPGCTRPAERCDVDHATSYRHGGCTDLANLGLLCRHHHQLKTHHGWRITISRRDGRCRWRSPRGRIYDHEPPGLLPPPPARVGSPPPF